MKLQITQNVSLTIDSYTIYNMWARMIWPKADPFKCIERDVRFPPP